MSILQTYPQRCEHMPQFASAMFYLHQIFDKMYFRSKVMNPTRIVHEQQMDIIFSCIYIYSYKPSPPNGSCSLDNSFRGSKTQK